jgi:hypothetical protein
VVVARIDCMYEKRDRRKFLAERLFTALEAWHVDKIEPLLDVARLADSRGSRQVLRVYANIVFDYQRLNIFWLV